MASAARAERRRQAREAAKTRTLYHGTAGVLVDQIKREGLRTGHDGRVFVTDSRAIARSYAVWEAARQAALGIRPDAASTAGRRALALGGHVGAVFTVQVTVPVEVEQESFPPPLPWETTMLDGVSYFATQPIAPEQLSSVEMWRIPELDDPARVEAVCRESELICGALHRRDAVAHYAPMLRRSALREAVPDHWGLLDAVIAASPDARSRWHGELHWLGVTAAAVRLIERGSPADPAVLLAFCLLHDAQRHSEGRDPQHGERAAALADRLHDDDLLRLDDAQRATLRVALVEHDRGLTSPDATIGACWDADRLTLPRVGIEVDPGYLSTPQARDLLAREPEAIPDPAACDWDWALSRMYLLATRPVVELDRLARHVREQIGERTDPRVAFEAVDVCAEAGFDVLGVDYARVVVSAGPGQVAKVGWHPEDGADANRTEMAVWLNAPEHVREVLSPCVRLTPAGALIQRRAEPLLSPANWLLGAADADVRAVADCRSRYGAAIAHARSVLLAYGLEDVDINQFGQLDDGRLVAFDYARASPALAGRLEPRTDARTEAWTEVDVALMIERYLTDLVDRTTRLREQTRLNADTSLESRRRELERKREFKRRELQAREADLQAREAQWLAGLATHSRERRALEALATSKPSGGCLS